MSEIGFTIPSFAKINLSLRIAGIREDGFHELFTVFQTVSLHDDIKFSKAAQISLISSDPLVPVDESNLIIRAANELCRFFGVNHGAQIHLEKRIPFPGGLGGGSSNAAVTLIGLARLWELSISHDELVKIAGTLGSDVPFFFDGGTAIGTGRGTLIERVNDITSDHMLIVTPQVDVSTAKAFELLGRAQLDKN